MFKVIEVRVLLLVIGYLEFINCAYSDTSETREVLHLEGIWNCYCERDNKPLDYREKHGLRKLNGVVKVPVPGSVIDFDTKSCPGSVWYERSFFIPKSWKYERKILMRLDGLAPNANVWINGEIIDINKHFFVKLDITDKLLYESENRIAIELKNTLKSSVVVSGILRSLSLLSVPEILYIESVSVESCVTNGTAYIKFKAIAGGLLKQNVKCISVQILDKDDIQVGYSTTTDSLEGKLSLPNCKFWWPLCMSLEPGYLYTLVFKLSYKYCESEIKDIYRMKIGIRPLSFSNNSWKMNDKSFYLQGVRGSDEWAKKPFSAGFDLKDFTLLKWLNSNAIFTSVAPSEETLELTDEYGVLVILGSPINELEDVITRYRHHPSVILWSLSEGGHCNVGKMLNESYIDRLKILDSTRPFTAEFPLLTLNNSKMISKIDIISISSENAFLKNDTQNTIAELEKPVIFLHGDQLLSTKKRIRTLNFNSNSRTNDRFDCLKNNNLLVGEFYGNFIAYECFEGDRLRLIDGMFNRNREPTTAAEFVRSKFGSKRRICCTYQAPRCKFFKNLRRRMMK